MKTDGEMPAAAAANTMAGIELMRRIRKGHFNLARLRLRDRRAPAVWDAVPAAR
jgi:hypothetical protein